MHALHLVIISIFWRAASVPRCEVKDYFQETPFIFSCGGSAGDRSTNIAKVHLKGTSDGFQDVITIPAGTVSFELSVDGSSSAEIHVIDIDDGSVNVVPDKLTKNEIAYSGSYKGVDITYIGASSSAPTTEKLTFSGSSPTPKLVVRVKSSATSSQDFSLGFYYFQYGTTAVQCQKGGAPVGCTSFDQFAAQVAASDWVKWLRTSHSTAASSWQSILDSENTGRTTKLTSVPSYLWCKVFATWPDSSSSKAPCGGVYKFVSGGGMEASIAELSQDQFEWVWKAPELEDFDRKCCAVLTAAHSSASSAWTAVQSVQLQYQFDTPIQALLQICQSAGTAPNETDYVKFLDGDADRPLGGFVSDDLAHCWLAAPAPSTTTTTSTSSTAAPTPSPTPAPTPAPTPPPPPAPTTTRTTTTSTTTTTLAAPQPVPSMEVPTVFHYETYETQQCSGTSFTKRKVNETSTSGTDTCNGFANISPEMCQDKCATSEQAPNCDRYPCEAAVYHVVTRRCYFFSADQCLSTTPEIQVTTFKKVAGGGQVFKASKVAIDAKTSLTEKVSAGASMLPVNSDAGFKVGRKIIIDEGGEKEESNMIVKFGSMVLQKKLMYDHAAGVSIIEPKEGVAPSPFLPSLPAAGQKNVPLMVGGAAAGMAGGAAVMGTIGVLVHSMQSPKSAGKSTNPFKNMKNPFAPHKKRDPFSGVKNIFTPPRSKQRMGPLGDVEVQTAITAPVPAGSLTLPVISHAGFLVGREIWIGVGTLLQEANEVSGFGSILLKRPLLHPHPPNTNITMPREGVTMPLPPTTTTTTTTMTTILSPMQRSSVSMQSASGSKGPMLPLVCLGLVCLCGLCALVVAAFLDPCQRPRKRVKSGDVGGSVASVGSVGSYGSEASDDAAWYDGYSDAYGGSVATVGTLGGSVYTQGSPSTAVSGYDYGQLPQDTQTYTYGFPTSAPLASVLEVSDLPELRPNSAYASRQASRQAAYGYGP